MANSSPVAVVTGCASGIGAATVEVLIGEGWRVVGVDRDEAGRAPDESYTGVVGDVTDAATNSAAVRAAVDTFGGLDALILNAGVVTNGPIDAQPLAEFETMLSVNLRAPILAIRAAMPALRTSERPAIVVTGSVSGLGGDAGLWGYCASKAGIINLVRSLAVELGPEGIRVNAVCPGSIVTPINQHARDDPRRERILISTTPMQRWGQPEEIGRAIAFLASPAASFITGVALPVDGGITATSGLPLSRTA
jgi:meso-butanediol dehydrogenase / (S,S)-butanediol dehydrogenase / diacetyl reductase